MKLRTGIFALALTMAAPLAVQAQTIDLGGGAGIDLRSNKQKQKDAFRERQARDEYRRDSMRRDAHRDRYRDRDIPTGSVRRHDDRGYGRSDYDRRDRW